MSIEAMKQALEALEYPGPSWPESRERAAQALRAAIEQAEKQEPHCAVIVEVFGKDWRLDYMSLPVGKHRLYTQEYVYTHQPAAQRQWVGLTEKDFSAINQSCLTKLQAATSAESILKEKNNGQR